MWPLSALANRFRPGRGSWHPFPQVRPPPAHHADRPRPLRLGVRRRHLRRPVPPRPGADRGPLPLRRARLDRRLPEPGLPGAVRRLRRRLRGAFSVGPALHPGQRDVHLRPVLRQVRLVERAGLHRPHLRDRAQPHRAGQYPGHDGDPGGAPRRHLHPERVLGVLPRREPQGDQAGRDRELAAVPVPGPKLRPPRGLGDVRVPDGQWDVAGRLPLLPGQQPAPPLHPGQRLLLDQRAPRGLGRNLPRLGRGVRLQRDHPPVLPPLPAAGDAHRNQPGRRAQWRRGRELALEGVGERAARAQ